ncbi:nicotinamidase [Sulfurihydrogenibium azorense]|jgi:nicotinamidase/pyrazinamidase|uniref:nicotinamidase n=1 Tax=Sulfurihydrogenibium azorense (strain DSM 15241 / OCM 825 / Az-Fu1) TaxID=204536 RepID=C1DU94_SULAA|nr:nicotinamidase [Sulfurihydrogenibium azorense]ACN99331.1 pyrazinamidase/nicotinamidase [Sulfurihydrogenibium azorense Az-Fu1]MDM7274130.1 nicotinamidase [Sulfurihydrogenibium azorense]
MKVKLTDKDALIVVDMQNDFMPYGVLPVKDADKIVPTINSYIELFEKMSNPVFFTRDWHPENHISFKGFGGIWPAHCVQNTEGAKFHPDLKIPSDNKFIISKGTSPDFDAYSGFQGTNLHSLLQERGIKRLFICGVATDFCVKNTAIGGLNLGYQVFLLVDAIKSVFPEKEKEVIKDLLDKTTVALTLKDIDG